MSGTRITLESLRLSFAGLAPDVARQALDGLDRELAGRLEGRLRASPASRLALEGPGRPREGGTGGMAGTRAVIEARQGMDAAALRALLADRLADILAGPEPAPTPRAGGRS